tara:strand:+ start:2000 stop:2110 length:111 start_codon:yes stop_codon:yes gene_type:complete
MGQKICLELKPGCVPDTTLRVSWDAKIIVSRGVIGE